MFKITDASNSGKIEVTISENKTGNYKWTIKLQVVSNINRSGADLSISRCKAQYTVSFNSTFMLSTILKEMLL